MSQWTHIMACFRIDTIYMERCPNFDINSPHGSKGGLHFQIWRNPRDSDIARFTVTVFGDLRDTDISGIEDTRKWFEECCQPTNMYYIRDAVLHINHEFNGIYIYTWQDNKIKIVGKREKDDD